MKTPHQHPIDPFKNEHFHALSFCWRIRESLKNNVETHRMKKYADWFAEHYLWPHFEIEEKYIFPILGLQNVRIKKALANHRRIKRLFAETSDNYISLNKIEEELSRYIRFEERILYKEIENEASKSQLEEIEKYHKKVQFSDKDWEDKFWEF